MTLTGHCGLDAIPIGFCNPKVVLTENKYFRIPSNGNFIRATLGLQKPRYRQQANNQEVAKEGISYNFTKTSPLNFKFLLVKLNLDQYKLRKSREISNDNVLYYLTYTI